MRPSKKSRLQIATPLRLHLYIQIRDVRKMIWGYLDENDREMILLACNSKRPYPSKMPDLYRCCSCVGFEHFLDGLHPHMKIGFADMLFVATRMTVEGAGGGAACRVLHYTSVKFPLSNWPTYYVHSLMKVACENNTYDVLRWIHDNLPGIFDDLRKFIYFNMSGSTDERIIDLLYHSHRIGEYFL